MQFPIGYMTSLYNSLALSVVGIGDLLSTNRTPQRQWDVRPVITLHYTRLCLASRPALVSLFLSLTGFEETSCHKSCGQKKMNSANNLKEISSRPLLSLS